MDAKFEVDEAAVLLHYVDLLRNDVESMSKMNNSLKNDLEKLNNKVDAYIKATIKVAKSLRDGFVDMDDKINYANLINDCIVTYLSERDDEFKEKIEKVR